MGKIVTEFIGTFFLVLTICLVVPSGSNLAPIAIGVMLMAMVYMGGHVSGAHYNPAVTLAVFLRGKCSAADIVPYWIAQLAGSAAAAFLAHAIIGKTCPVAPADSISPFLALGIEAIFTFALALVVLNVATAKGTANNSFYGLAIGLTVTAAAFAAGSLSGGAFNPAVGLGPNIVAQLKPVAVASAAVDGVGAMNSVWIYFAGPLIGGALAAGVFKVQNPQG